MGSDQRPAAIDRPLPSGPTGDPPVLLPSVAEWTPVSSATHRDHMALARAIFWLRHHDEIGLATELTHAAIHHDGESAAPVLAAWLDG